MMGSISIMGYKVALLKLSTLKELKRYYSEHAKRYNEESLRLRGREDGEKEIPKLEQEDPAPFERELKHACARLASHIVTRYRAVLEQLDAKIKTERQYVENVFRDSKESSERIHQLEREAVENGFGLKDAHQHLEMSEKHYKRLREEYGRVPIHYIPHWLYVIFALLIFLGEIPLNALVFQIFGENQVMTWVMAFIIGLSVPLAAHFIGIKIRESEGGISWPNISKAFVGTAVIVAALYGLSLMRQIYLGEFKEALGLTDTLVESSFMFFWLNIAVFFAAIMVAYLSHDPAPGFGEAEAEYNKARKAVQKLERRRLKQLRKIGTAHRNIIDELNKHYRDGMSRVNMLNGAYDQILREGQEHELRCLERLKQQLATYRHANVSSRENGEMPKCFSVEPSFALKLENIQEKFNNDDLELPRGAANVPS